MLRGPVAFHLRPCFGHGAYQSMLGPKADESETRQGLSLISWGELVSFCC